MKKYIRCRISRTHPAAAAACVFMLLSAVIRISYYCPLPDDPFILTVHVIFPVTAAVLHVIGNLAGGERFRPFSLAALVLGIAFFVIKALSFAPVHRFLCILLYLTVLSLYSLTILGFLPTKKLLYPLFGLPLAYHLLVEDTRLYFFADPPVPIREWMPEISVLCIMAALLSQSFAVFTEPAADIPDA